MEATGGLLAGVAALLAMCAGAFRVEGHTDDRPSCGMSNVKLSDARARSVCTALAEEHGVDPLWRTAVGYGDTKPRAPNATQGGRTLRVPL